MGILGEQRRSPLHGDLSYLVAVSLDLKLHDICFPGCFLSS
jgi:hypothetical protein